MKTAEDFLEEKGQMVFTHYDRKTLIWLMEQFRKEGMEEAYNYMANISDLEIKSGDYLEFEEWYNNQIKEG